MTDFPSEEVLVTVNTVDRPYPGYRKLGQWHICVADGGDVPVVDEFVTGWQAREG